ncbi:probable N-acetyltransferase HLS1-like [Phragmites australis]|uniref:probable N-acetyltransferase HLS1-like n=1 Tax=Phragmites australis TaxID=29695 RepID=UPI002D77CBC5|nr:probable N-acetyltransferase HLS1-like [Phragmites australis]
MVEAEALVVREYDSESDRGGVEEVERACEVGSSGAGKMCLFTDLLGDPLCRIRNSPAYLMLVAETATGGGETNGTEIAGLVRGCVKYVVSGSTRARDPIYTKVGYILGLRVSPSHRRKGVGKKLVDRMEEWFRQMGAEYSYMATEQDNEASVRLFTGRCGYAKFRTPSVLVHPVFGHALEPSRSAVIVRLELREAELLYRWHFAAVEFFPADIDAVLSNALSLGTFLAIPAGSRWEGVEAFLASPPVSWAVLSVWNCMDAFRLEVRGAPRLMRAAAGATRLVDRAAPWLKIPSIPNLFAPFGLYFLYGLSGAGPDAPRLARALCRHAHNMARRGGCGVVATEISASEPVRAGVPHWARLSADDLWCIKRLADGYSDGPLGDWTKAPAGHSIFIDPREF